MVRPNILFVFADDQRFDTIGALGNPEIHTPNLDRLAERGTAFTHAHIPGGTSPAVCMPSRAMLHTGRTLFGIAGEGQGISADHTLLGEALRQAGYATFGTGKWHNGPEAFARSFSDGADIFFGGMDDHWNVPACDFDPSGRYAKMQPFVKDPFIEREVRHRLADHIRPGVHSTDLFTEATLDFFARRDQAQPFFAYVSLMAPHDPRTMPRRFLDLYDPAALTLPSNLAAEHAIDTGALDVRDERLGKRPRDPDDVRQHLAEYYAMITHLDEGFGRLVDDLEARGELDNTIVVFAGDNGLALGQHGLFGKQNLYDHSVRVPLLFAGPGIREGARCDDLVYLLDLFPTLCSLAHIPVPETVEGIDHSPVLRGEPGTPTRDALYLVYCHTIRGVTTGRMKLIEYFGGETQLFDMVNDPAETQNLAHIPAQAEHVRDLRCRLVELSHAWVDRGHRHGAAFWKNREDLSG